MSPSVSGWQCTWSVPKCNGLNSTLPGTPLTLDHITYVPLPSTCIRRQNQAPKEGIYFSSRQQITSKLCNVMILLELHLVIWVFVTHNLWRHVEHGGVRYHVAKEFWECDVVNFMHAISLVFRNCCKLWWCKPKSRTIILGHMRCRQHDSPKRWYRTASVRGVTTKKTAT
jgi:hypothetical protein